MIVIVLVGIHQQEVDVELDNSCWTLAKLVFKGLISIANIVKDMEQLYLLSKWQTLLQSALLVVIKRQRSCSGLMTPVEN